MKREPERRDRHVELTGGQSLVAQSVISSLSNAREQRKLIVIKGLSGVGKSTVLQNIEGSVVLHGGRIVDSDDIRYTSRDPNIRNYAGHLVTTSTVGEFDEDVVKVAKRKYKGVTVEVHILPGMNEQETNDYLSHIPHTNQAGLSKDQIVQYSMGIPLLVDQLSRPGIDSRIAARICAAYLRRSFKAVHNLNRLRTLSKPYIRIGIPDDVQPSLEELFEKLLPDHIYGYLHRALTQMEMLKHQGVNEESPVFIAPESEQIFDAMLQSDGIAEIDIFVPQLSAEDLTRIHQAFGFNGYQYDPGDATRAKMFDVEYRKVSFWHRDTTGKMISDEDELQHLDRKALAFVDAFKTGKLMMRQDTSRGQASFYIHAHGHHRETHHPTSIGWMVESLLQQRGIAYFVNNRTYDASYVYTPEEQHIRLLPERVVIEWF